MVTQSNEAWARIMAINTNGWDLFINIKARETDSDDIRAISSKI